MHRVTYNVLSRSGLVMSGTKHQRSVELQGYRSGHYQRNFHTKAGDVRLKVPKLKNDHL